MDRMTFRYAEEDGFDKLIVGGVGVVTSLKHSAMLCMSPSMSQKKSSDERERDRTKPKGWSKIKSGQ